MAVFKKIVCSNNSCKRDIKQVDKEPDDKMLAGMTCPKCGSAPRVSPNWGVSVYLIGSGGKAHKHVKMIGTKKEAEAYERKILGERDNGERHAKKKDWSFASFAKEFEDWIATRIAEGKLADGSAKSYRMRMEVHLLPWLGKTDIRQIDAKVVTKYRVSRLKEVAPATVNREIATLKKALNVAVDNGWLPRSPLMRYEMLDEDNENDRYLTDPEIEALKLACLDVRAPQHLYPIVLLGLNTGLRIEGVLELRWEHVKWEINEIHRTVKGKKQVRIPMTPELRQCLQQWQGREGVTRITGWVFPSTKKPERAMLITSNFGLATACKRANIEDCTYHTLRHTFATHVLEQYPDQMETLRVIMGHSTDYMTRRYAHITDKARHKMMAEFKIGGVQS